MKHTIQEIEQKIVRQIISDALNSGYAVAHHNGDEITSFAQMVEGAELENEIERIMREINQTDEEMLILKKKGKTIGSINLVYGNDGHDVVADYTDVPEMAGVLHNAAAVAEKYADKAA